MPQKSETATGPNGAIHHARKRPARRAKLDWDTVQLVLVDKMAHKASFATKDVQRMTRLANNSLYVLVRKLLANGLIEEITTTGKGRRFRVVGATPSAEPTTGTLVTITAPKRARKERAASSRKPKPIVGKVKTASASDKIPVKEFVAKMIRELRKPPYLGVHVVYSQFNDAFRVYYRKDPRADIDMLVAEGFLKQERSRGGVVITLMSDLMVAQPKGKSSNKLPGLSPKVAKALAKVTGTSR
ncbi:MAG: hypothetical protein AAB421_04910 [Patescibacteria group bacterium]